MEIWIDPETNRIKAIYSGKYTGTVWQSQGFEKYNKIEGWMLPYEAPPPALVEYPSELKLKGADGKTYTISIDTTGKLVTKQELVI